MAISDTDKVDLLYKQYFGTAKTASGTVKFASNETIPSQPPILPSQIWGAADDIPAQAPGSTAGVVQVYAGATAIQMTNDPTAPVNVAWLATSSFGDPTTRMTDFIPSTFGSSYAVKVWIGNPVGGPAARIFPDATNEEWIFIYPSGVLMFPNTIPANKTATVGSGTVSVATHGVYIEVQKYTGERLPEGASSLGQLTDVDLTTASPADGDLLTFDIDTQTWVPKTPIAPPQDLGHLTDVDFATAAPSPGDVLTYTDGVWEAITPVAPPQELSQLTDVDLTTATPATGDVLTFSADGVWEAITPPVVPADGFHLQLGDVVANGDGSWSPGAVPLTNTTPVSEAVDLMNEVLAKLVPAQPPAFPNSTTLTITNTSGTTPLLASGVTDNSGSSGITAGTAVTRIITSGVSSNTFNDVGPGDSGAISVQINNVTVGTRTLNGSSDNGTYNGLVLSDEKDYPVSTPGFWKSLDVQLTLVASSQGINKAQILHSGAGNTGAVYYVRDNITAVPTISGGTVTQATAGTLAYSSSIPHYGTGGQLTVNASYSNVSGETYYGGTDPFTITGTNSIIAAKARTYANIGFSTPIARQTTGATAITAQTVDVDGTNVHNSGLIQGTAKNVNGSSTTVNLSNTVILVKRGTAGSRIDENSIPVTGLGSNPNGNNGVRVSTASGDKPSAAPTAWDSTAALASHEATCVGGVFKHDQTNYSTNFLPVGPDLSGKPTVQYFTISFKRTPVSAFKITIAGTYAGMWIKLPGVSDAQPNGGGWWDMFQSYDGSGIPGETGDANAGCALGAVATGASGTFQATFGTASSNSATGNEILVHIRLNSGQSVTGLSFSN